MSNPEHLEILKKGVKEWRQWRIKHPDIAPGLHRADLSKADLTRADLRKTDLRRADLREAHLHDADLRDADLSGADLSQANLSGADLFRTDFGIAKLSGADLSGANLLFTNFMSTNIEGANFTDSVIANAVFANVDLSQAKGLKTVSHSGPSTIGTDTLERSQGKIPEIFLRGAGVSDEFIAVIRAMIGAIQFYSCFISYSTKDQLFAERLYADLQARGVRCWFAPHDVQGGKKLHEQIDNAIQVHERLLLILSPESIHSEWVKTEIAKARNAKCWKKDECSFPSC